MLSDKEEGYKAYWNGQTESDNPYQWNSRTWWLADEWNEGWMEAEDDYDDD